MGCKEGTVKATDPGALAPAVPRRGSPLLWCGIVQAGLILPAHFLPYQPRPILEVWAQPATHLPCFSMAPAAGAGVWAACFRVRHSQGWGLTCSLCSPSLRHPPPAPGAPTCTAEAGTCLEWPWHPDTYLAHQIFCS